MDMLSFMLGKALGGSGGGGGGGASNIVTGTFTTETSNVNYVKDFDTGYTGNGYPIAGILCADGGLTENTDWRTLTQKVGFYAFAKSAFNTAPAYSGGANDTATCHMGYMYSGNYSRGGFLENSFYKQDAPLNSVQSCLACKDKSTMRCFVNIASDYGFAPGTTYRYWIVYSE